MKQLYVAVSVTLDHLMVFYNYLLDLIAFSHCP